MPDPSDVLTRPAPPPDTTVRYGDRPDQVADIWLPASPGGRPGAAPRAVVVVIHGGFWRAGYDRVHTRPMCTALAAEGYAVAAIEYRRTGMPGGGWPGTFDDVRAALAVTPDLALHAGAGRADRPGGPAVATVLVGHSAGGQLAVWAATLAPDSPDVSAPREGQGSPDADNSLVPRLRGVVSLAGVVDLAAAYRRRLGAEGDDGAVTTLLGGGPADVPDRYDAVDPCRLPPPPAPVTLVHGALDRTVPVELSHSYAAHARFAGGRAEVVELAGIEHFGVIDPRSPAWPAVVDAIARLSR